MLAVADIAAEHARRPRFFRRKPRPDCAERGYGVPVYMSRFGRYPLRGTYRP